MRVIGIEKVVALQNYQMSWWCVSDWFPEFSDDICDGVCYTDGVSMYDIDDFAEKEEIKPEKESQKFRPFQSLTSLEEVVMAMNAAINKRTH